MREHSITCSHVWHIDIPKCVNYSDTQSVKVWQGYNTSDMNARKLCIKVFPKELNKIKRCSRNCGHIWHIYTSKYVY